MDTSDPDITFDDQGVCCYCKIYDERMKNEVFCGSEGEQRLKVIVDKMKEAGRGKPYDCLIGVSGGADSTTAVWTLKMMDLRVLAVHLDNGWDSELAVDNIKKTLEKLEVDLYTYVLDWDEFRDLQLAFLKASVPNCEIPTDHAIIALHFKVALDQGIKYIANGANVATEAFIPRAWSYESRDLRHLRAIHQRFGTVPLRSFPTLGMISALYTILVKGIRWITVLNYVDYKKPQAIKLLQEELGWRPYGGKHYESVYTRFYQGYILKKKFGFDKKRAHLANLVLSGNLSRDQALAEVEQEDYIGTALWSEDYEFVVKKFGLSQAQFEEIMALPVKTHYDFPSNRWAIERMPRLFDFFKKIATRVY
jgi:N-acetyl sugar amidotransferase